MRRARHEIIEFPANPFVALADFLIVLLLVLVLAVLHQSVSSNRLIARMAVDDLQKLLLSRCRGADSGFRTDPVLRRAFDTKLVAETYRDGDLQRFWFDSRLLYPRASTDGRGPTAAKPEGGRILAAFGSVLRQHQGNPSDPNTRPFKRIIVEGHADRSEGDDAQVWALSLARAGAAVRLLVERSGIHPMLVEASGRGCWERPNPRYGGGSSAARSRRLEIVVVYSDKRALEYLKGEP
jgi:hypothetical protein